MKFIIRGDDINVVPTDKGEWRTRKLVLLGEGELDQQFCELNLPDTHPPIGVGKGITLRVRKVTAVWQGNARIIADVLSIDGKAVAPVAA